MLLIMSVIAGLSGVCMLVLIRAEIKRKRECRRGDVEELMSMNVIQNIAFFDKVDLRRIRRKDWPEGFYVRPHRLSENRERMIGIDCNNEPFNHPIDDGFDDWEFVERYGPVEFEEANEESSPEPSSECGPDPESEACKIKLPPDVEIDHSQLPGDPPTPTVIIEGPSPTYRILRDKCIHCEGKGYIEIRQAADPIDDLLDQFRRDDYVTDEERQAIKFKLKKAFENER